MAIKREIHTNIHTAIKYNTGENVERVLQTNSKQQIISASFRHFWIIIFVRTDLVWLLLNFK